MPGPTDTAASTAASGQAPGNASAGRVRLSDSRRLVSPCGPRFPGDLIGRLRHACRVDDLDSFQAEAAALETVEQSDPAAKDDRREFDVSSSRSPARRHGRMTDAPIGGTSMPATAPSLPHGAGEASGAKGVAHSRHCACRHSARRPDRQSGRLHAPMAVVNSGHAAV
jgi:hypothetical protein